MKKAKVTNKAAFITSNANLSAAEVVAKGKREGVELSTNYVYAVRSKAAKTGRRAARVEKAKPAPVPETGVAKIDAPVVLSARGKEMVAEELLSSVAAVIGLQKAIGILQAELDGIRKMMWGSP